MAAAPRRKVWLFDLDDTLHDAHRSTMPGLSLAMGRYIEAELGLSKPEADALRRRYFQRYGATLLGLVRHHGVRPAHFLDHTHRLPELEAGVRCHRHDVAALAALPGRRYVLTNAPRAYALRVLRTLGLLHLFDGVLTIEDMAMFGDLRPKPDARMLRRLAARLGVAPSRCVLVEDSLANLKGARRAGMQTVWMRRWLHALPLRQHERLHKPPQVGRRVHHLRELLRGPA
ncbi:pyrimidine 5'-nucleotidase [Pseudorhodoferax sp.]|uniref:pyrimidine 5'-nucleotidase n=1 Tax=Pseudorhodoferax sp. TaxID=1993553 RepID=UPI002DD69AD6|nr:pyrimidine 5'-nucleotidase [Pseudorhodoferax sp.]